MQIDGMHVNEYASLKTLVGNIFKIEEDMSHNEHVYGAHI